MKRISNLQLGQIDLTLTDHDRKLLAALKQFRFMKTNQVQRLFFPPLTSTPRAALTATTRALNRLMKCGLVNHLEKRVGGVRAGSQGLIWHITEAGIRLLMMYDGEEQGRKRIEEPSTTFLRHILAVTECYIQTVSICRCENNMHLEQITIEPECWREYELGAKNISLRPDLFAETISDDYRDFWFIEVDLDTESVGSIISKCKRYHEYYNSDLEQKKNGVFPVVLFIVPDEKRKKKIREAISESFRGSRAKIFMVITPNELHQTLKIGVEEEKLC